MSVVKPTLDDIRTPENVYLFNLLFAHQVFLEGVKSSFANDFVPVLKRLFDEFTKYMYNNRYETMDKFTRGELELFIYKFQRAQIQFFSAYTQKLIDLLKKFVAVEVEASRNIFQEVTGLTPEDANKIQSRPKQTLEGLAEIAANGNGSEALWERIVNEPIPASGHTISTQLVSFTNAATARIGLLIRKGYANSDSREATLGTIVGTQRKNYYSDGLFATLNRQNMSVVSTIVQHVSAITQAAVAAAYYGEYIWVSTLDSRTTPICQERSGNVYSYSDGPLPPAHYNCRSKSVPKVPDEQSVEIPNTLHEWLLTQSDKVQNLLLGSSLADQLRAGKLAQDITLNDLVQQLTLNQFAEKIQKLLQLEGE